MLFFSGYGILYLPGGERNPGGLKSLFQLKGSDKMKKVLLIALAAVMVAAAVFVGGYAAGKAAEHQPIVWIDETGEIYVSR